MKHIHPHSHPIPRQALLTLPDPEDSFLLFEFDAQHNTLDIMLICSWRAESIADEDVVRLTPTQAREVIQNAQTLGATLEFIDSPDWGVEAIPAALERISRRFG